jgi:hypothetical protein
MKKYIILITFSSFLLAFKSFGQVYEKVYSSASSEVQNHMNQNKIAGIQILSGVKTHHVIGLAGINVTQKASLETLLSNDIRINSFVINDDVTSLVIDSEAVFTKEEFQNLIQALNAVITGYTADYSI